MFGISTPACACMRVCVCWCTVGHRRALGLLQQSLLKGISLKSSVPFQSRSNRSTSNPGGTSLACIHTHTCVYQPWDHTSMTNTWREEEIWMANEGKSYRNKGLHLTWGAANEISHWHVKHKFASKSSLQLGTSIFHNRVIATPPAHIWGNSRAVHQKYSFYL